MIIDHDFWRGLVFAQAALVFMMTLAILVKYSLAWALKPKEDRTMPWHIALISTSYLLATVFVCIEIRTRWGESLTYRTPLAGAIFILGDAALIFMLVHLSIQRQYMGQIREHIIQEAAQEKTDLALELKRQTGGLAQMIKAAGEKADSAYHEANGLNQKIIGFNEEVSDKLSQNAEQLTNIQGNAETARIKAAEAVEKAGEIGETGNDTNVRVRHIQEGK